MGGKRRSSAATASKPKKAGPMGATGSVGSRTEVPLFPSASRTASANGADQANKGPYRGLVLVIDTTLVPGAAPSTGFTVQGKDPVSGKYYTILASAAIVAVGTVVLRIYPGLVAAANLVASDVLPSTWRVITTHGNANPVTYSVAALLIP